MESQYLPIELWNIIFHYLDFKHKHILKLVCKKFNNELLITDLFSIDHKYLCKLDQEIIKRYSHATKLDASSNKNIKDVSHMSNLRVLWAEEGECGINQNGIKGLNLEELRASRNSKIKNVSYMKNLKFLGACGDCGIDQNGIKDLDLEKLRANRNSKIKDVSHMRNLKILWASGDCGIDQNGIKNLDLKKLCMSYNPKIKDVSHMKDLEIL